MSNNGKLNELKPTSAEEWSELYTKGVVVQLPSGMVARLRPIGVESLVRSGRIPDDLSPLAAMTIWRGQPTDDQIMRFGKGSIDLINIIAEAAFMEPRVVIDGESREVGPGELSIDHVDLADKTFILSFVSAPAAALRSFRRKQEGDVATIHAGEDPESEAVRASGVLD